MMIPYPCWLLLASAVRIMKVASCIARMGMQTLYTAELAIASPAPRSVLPSPAHRARHPAADNAWPGLRGCERGRCKGSPISDGATLTEADHRRPADRRDGFERPQPCPRPTLNSRVCLWPYGACNRPPTPP